VYVSVETATEPVAIASPDVLVAYDNAMTTARTARAADVPSWPQVTDREPNRGGNLTGGCRPASPKVAPTSGLAADELCQGASATSAFAWQHRRAERYATYGRSIPGLAAGPVSSLLDLAQRGGCAEFTT
jgi:hypothetical protein